MADPTPTAPPATAWREALRLSRHIRTNRWAAPVIVVLGVGAALAETLSVGLAVMLLFALLGQSERIAQGGGLLAQVYDRLQGILGADPYHIAAVFLGLIVMNAALVYANHVTIATMMNHIAQRMRDLVHRQYVTVAYRYLQRREHGELIHVLATETWVVSDAFFHLSRVAVNLCAVVVFGIGLFSLSWVIGLTALVCAVAGFVLLRLLSRPVERLGQETLAANQVLAERMLISLTGMRTLRAFAQEDYVLRVFSAASSRVRRLAIRAERIKALTGPLSEIASLGTLLVIVVVSQAAGVAVTTTIAAVLLLFRLQPHLREIEASRMMLAGMNAALAAVRSTLDEDKPHAVEGPERFTALQREIRFENVNFSHDPRRRASLESASFVLRAGQTTALAGPSGSGKTTILNLILRLYDPDAGRITVDGRDLAQFSRASWLARVAIAGQDVELIEGTLIQNIRMGTHDADMEQVRHVCAMVEILDDIDALPDGFDTRIGAAGLSFSGGQRQRIGLARALLRAPDLLILDEAMSAMEPAREDRIRQRINTLMRGKTILFVSHRADTSLQADSTVQIDSGRIILQD